MLTIVVKKKTIPAATRIGKAAMRVLAICWGHTHGKSEGVSEFVIIMFRQNHLNPTWTSKPLVSIPPEIQICQVPIRSANLVLEFRAAEQRTTIISNRPTTQALNPLSSLIIKSS